MEYSDCPSASSFSPHHYNSETERDDWSASYHSYDNRYEVHNEHPDNIATGNDGSFGNTSFCSHQAHNAYYQNIDNNNLQENAHVLEYPLQI